ncbi:hypothetical protein DAEQUDRAFT_768972 [Daedalea quercina L-15889]|uniref:DUF6533 domain-containing protein n=1 Tax=Daedalea quercina L-15889 TaxID=1314783 RepID=A0A165M783_9APHY|nr:hypothetical protein DAEQUDRAFT_768972 [Daedalea quercina L-15889]
MSTQIAATISQEFLENCFTVSAQALCCYDFCLTFTREVKFMWKLKPSIGSILFFTLRYPALCNTIMVILGYLSWGSWQSQLVSAFPICVGGYAYEKPGCMLNDTADVGEQSLCAHDSELTDRSCTVMMRLEMAGDVLILTSSSIFTAVRIYALSGRGRWRLCYMLVLGLINPVMSTYTFVLSAPYLARLTPHYQTCDIDTQWLGDIGEFRTLTSGMMCARASGVIFDAIALLLTWLSIKRVIRARNQPDEPESDHRSVSGLGTMTVVLMRDTAVYFGQVVARLLPSKVTHLPSSPGQFLDAVSTWSAVMTSILLSRLMLDLRQANSTDSAGGTYISHALTTMAFDGPSRNSASAVEEEMDSDLFGSESEVEGADSDVVREPEMP